MSKDEIRAWQEWGKENLDDWGFLGPCYHGRDPYIRCDICAILRPEEAEAVAKFGRKEDYDTSTYERGLEKLQKEFNTLVKCYVELGVKT